MSSHRFIQSGRYRGAAAIIIAAGVMWACREPAGADGDGLITFMLTPTAAALAPGDTVVVRAQVSALVRDMPISVRWRSAGGAVARLDTTVANGSAVVLRAVMAGMDSVRATIPVGGQTVEAWLPVTVRARP